MDCSVFVSYRLRNTFKNFSISCHEAAATNSAKKTINLLAGEKN
jgi:hypothetical protein